MKKTAYALFQLAIIAVVVTGVDVYTFNQMAAMDLIAPHASGRTLFFLALFNIGMVALAIRRLKWLVRQMKADPRTKLGLFLLGLVVLIVVWLNVITIGSESFESVWGYLVLTDVMLAAFVANVLWIQIHEVRS